MREAAAHHAGVRLDRDGLGADPAEKILIGGLHRLVALDGALVGRVERVGIHHDKLARAHQAKARPDLVAELGRNLEEILGEVAVARDLGADERRDDLLVCRPQHVLRLARTALAVAGAVHAEHDFPGRRPAGALLPVFGRMHVGHLELDAAAALDLLAADLGELLHHPQAQRQEGVEASAQLAHQAGPDEQLVRGNLGVGRAFFERGDKILGPELHGVRQRNTARPPAQIYLRPGPGPELLAPRPCPPRPAPASPGP